MEGLCIGSWGTLVDAGGYGVALWGRRFVGEAFAGSGVRIQLVLGRHIVVLAFPGDKRRRGLASACSRGWNLENPGKPVCERRGRLEVDQLERGQRCRVDEKEPLTSSYSSSCSGVSSLRAAG
jgi:hypothetical protein